MPSFGELSSELLRFITKEVSTATRLSTSLTARHHSYTMKTALYRH